MSPIFVSHDKHRFLCHNLPKSIYANSITMQLELVAPKTRTTCGELICYQCAIKGGKHHSHDYDLLQKAFENYKGEITSSLEPLEEHLATIKKALTQLDTRCWEISDQRVVIEADIHKAFRQLQEILDLRKTANSTN